MIIAETVPKHLREGFIFHASELTRRGAYLEDEWKFKDRLQTVHAMMGASSSLGGMLVWAAVRATLSAGPLRAPGISMSEGENHHLIAFRNCLGALNLYLEDKNDYGGAIVEKSERMSWRLNALAINMGRNPFPLTITALTKPDGTPLPQRVSRQVKLSTDRIKDPVAFFPKSYPPLWLADACAYGIRSFLAGLKYGPGYFQLITRCAPETVSNELCKLDVVTGTTEFPG